MRAGRESASRLLLQPPERSEVESYFSQVGENYANTAVASYFSSLALSSHLQLHEQVLRRLEVNLIHIKQTEQGYGKGTFASRVRVQSLRLDPSPH